MEPEISPQLALKVLMSVAEKQPLNMKENGSLRAAAIVLENFVNENVAKNSTPEIKK